MVLDQNMVIQEWETTEATFLFFFIRNVINVNANGSAD